MEKKSLIKSKIFAWVALGLIIAVLILSMVLPDGRKEWWQMIDIFFYFMAAFSHLAALYLEKMSVAASRQLDKIAFIFGVLGILALIVIFIIDNFFSVMDKI